MLSSGDFRQLWFQLFFLMASPPAPLATSSAPSTSSVPTVATSMASSSLGSDLATRVLQSLLQSAQRLGILPPTSSLATSTGSSTPSAPSTETGGLFCAPLFLRSTTRCWPQACLMLAGIARANQRLCVHRQAYLHQHLLPSLARMYSAECRH